MSTHTHGPLWPNKYGPPRPSFVTHDHPDWLPHEWVLILECLVMAVGWPVFFAVLLLWHVLAP